jgi:hypothetical protein
VNVQHILTLKSSGSWLNSCLPRWLTGWLAGWLHGWLCRTGVVGWVISGEASGQEHSKGLSEYISCFRVSQFRLYANTMSFAEAGKWHLFE